MTTKIVQSTPRGQITLPKQWRDRFSTDNYVLHMDGHKLVILPFDIEQATEEVLFDADRDNDGKGVSPDEMIKLLKNQKSKEASIRRVTRRNEKTYKDLV